MINIFLSACHVQGSSRYDPCATLSLDYKNLIAKHAHIFVCVSVHCIVCKQEDCQTGHFLECRQCHFLSTIMCKGSFSLCLKKCIVHWTLMGIFQQYLNLFHVKLPHDNHSTLFLMKLHLISLELFWHITVSAWHKFSSCIFHPKLLSRVSKVRFRCRPISPEHNSIQVYPVHALWFPWATGCQLKF